MAEISIRASSPDDTLLNQRVRLRATITNQTDKALPRDTRIRYLKNDHYGTTSAHVGIIEPYSDKEVYLTLRPEGGANIRTLSAEFTLSLESKVANLIKQGFKKTKLCSFTGDLKCYNEDAASHEPLNILIYGAMGGGKSSFIQTCLTMLSPNDKPLQFVTSVGGTGAHGSKNLRMHDLPGLNCKLWDTWGLNNKTYKENELQIIVQGLLPDNWSMTDVKPDAATMVRGFKTKAMRRQHAVLFFLTQGTLMAEDDMQGAKRQFGKISNMGLNPIVVIARADEIEPNIRSAPMSKFAEIEKQRETTAQAFGIPLSRVHISVPYCAEEERVFDIERQAYNVLDRQRLNSRPSPQQEKNRGAVLLTGAMRRRTSQHVSQQCPLSQCQPLQCQPLQCQPLQCQQQQCQPLQCQQQQCLQQCPLRRRSRRLPLLKERMSTHQCLWHGQ
jgi:predicted GTPase